MKNNRWAQIKAAFIAVLLVPIVAQASQVVFWEKALPVETARPANIIQGPDGAMWFTEGFAAGKLGRLSNDGDITELGLPKGLEDVGTLAQGSDNAIWFTQPLHHSIGRITTDGVVTEYPLPACHYPQRIVAGKDQLWFMVRSSQKAIAPYPEGCSDYSGIAQITTSGTITEFPIPVNSLASDRDGTVWFSSDKTIGKLASDGSQVGIQANPLVGAMLVAIASDGALWFTDFDAGKIVRKAASGEVIEQRLPAGGRPDRVSLAEWGDLWFTDADRNAIGRMTSEGKLDEIELPHANSYPSGIVQGPDGAIWFTEYNGNRIGRVAGMMTASMPVYTLAGVTLGSTLREPQQLHRGARRYRSADGWLWTWKIPEGSVNAYTDQGQKVTSVEFVAERPQKAPENASIDLPCTHGFSLQGSHVNLEFAMRDCRLLGLSTFELPDGSIVDVTFEGSGDGPLQRAVWYRSTPSPESHQ